MRSLHNQWKGILFRGIVALLFGIIAIGWPGIGLQVIVYLFGIYALVDGFFAFFIGFPLKSILFILEGLLGIIAGFIIFFNPLFAIAVFIYLVGIWAIVTGILEIFAAIELRKYITNEVWYLFVGIISIIFGVIVFANPLAAGIAVSFVIGVYALLFGALLITISIKLKNIHSPKKTSTKKKRK